MWCTEKAESVYISLANVMHLPYQGYGGISMICQGNTYSLGCNGLFSFYYMALPAADRSEQASNKARRDEALSGA